MNLLKKIIQTAKDAIDSVKMTTKLKLFIRSEKSREEYEIVRLQERIEKQIREDCLQDAFRIFLGLQNRKDYIKSLEEFQAYLLSEVKEDEKNED